MDPTSYAAPARVKSLVLPVGALKISQFEQYYARLCRAAEVLLIDVHLPSKEGDSTGNAVTRHFDPKTNPTGRITYDFGTLPVPVYQKPLLDLEPWRQQSLVIGVAHYSTTETENLETVLVQLRKKHSAALYHVVLVFGVPQEAAKQSHEDWPKGVFPVMKSNLTSLESILSTLSGEYLARLSTHWSTRQLSSFQSPSALVEHNNPSHHKHTPSNVVIGKHGSISMTSSERAKSRQEGRTLKYLGSLYLMCGLVPDALAELGTAATILKDHDDHLWYGSALSEIALCLVILKYEGNPTGIPSTAVSAASAMALSWAKRNKSGQPISREQKDYTSSHSTTPHYTTTSTTNAAVSSSPSNPSPLGSAANTPKRTSSPVSPYSHSRTGSTASSQTITPSASRSSSHSAVRPSSHSMTQDPESGGSPRSSISVVRTSSMRKPKSFTDQTPLEDLIEFLVLAVLEEYSLGRGSELVSYTVYYETIARFVNLLICLQRGWSKYSLAKALRPHGPKDEPEELTETPTFSMIVIENWISKVYDISLNELGPDTQARILGTVAQLYAKAGFKRKWAFVCAQIVSLLASTRATVDANLGHVEDVLRVYSQWPKLEAAMLRNLVALGQRTQNPRLQTDAASRLLAMVRDNRNAMMDKEQMTMYHLIRSYGDVVQSTFWDPKVVVNASVKTHKLTTIRANSRKQSLASLDSTTPPSSATIPISKSASGANSGAPPPSANGGIIYNPFEGTEFMEEGSIERGIPTSGRIILRNPLAIDIQVFELALVNHRGEYVSEVVKDVVIPAQATHYKVDASVLPRYDTQLEVSGCYIQISGCVSQVIPLPEVIRIPVIPARPVLVLQTLSLTKGWTMLLEGEHKRFSIKLWNSSRYTPSNILHFGFNESTVDLLRQAVAKQDVSRSDFYETEYFLHKRRTINLVEEPNEPIAPRSSQSFEFDLYGKRGVSSAAILVDYGLSEDSLRRLKIPLQVTIFPSISVERVNILPTNTTSTVLLVLDMRNSWQDRLECKLWVDDGEAPIIQAIDAGASRRFFIPVPWSPLSLEELQQPIPSFSKRQYTVDTKTTPEQLQLFWLRERLLSKLHGEWSTGSMEAEKPGDRKGYIELRTIQLSRRMAEILKTSVIEVKARPVSQAEIDKPTLLVVEVKNKSESLVQGMLRLVPNKAAMRYMLVIGVSQQLITVPAGQQAEAKFHVVFLSHGPFELSSVLDPVSSLPGATQNTIQGIAQSTQGSVFQTSETIVHI